MTHFIQIESHMIAYTDNQVSKQIMVFIHGLPTSKELFSKMVEGLEDDYRVITVDLLNYGESARINRPIEHKERAKGFQIFFEKLNLNNIILVSHDLGASVAIDIMAVCPDRIDKLIIMSPPVYPDFPVPFIVKLVRSKAFGPLLISVLRNILLKKSIERGLYNQPNYELYLKAYLEKAFSGRAGGAALLLNLRWGEPGRTFKNYPDIINSITQQVLILQGVQDPYIPYEHVQRLQNDIVNSKLIMLENASHFLPIDVPELLVHEIKTFLD